MVPGDRSRAAPRRRIFRPAAAPLALLLAAALAAAACRAEIVVDVDVESAIRGRVTVSVQLDESVLRWAPDIAELVRTSDLPPAGWEVSTATAADAAADAADTADPLSGLVLTARKQFHSADQLNDVLTEIDGAGGIFGPATLEIERDHATTTFDLTLEVRTHRDVFDMIDPSSTGLFGGNPFGLPTADLETRAGRPLNETVSLVVRATTPNGWARLPDTGALTLGTDQTERLHVAGELFDADMDAAEQAARDARNEARLTTVLVVLWWAVLAVVAVGIVAIYVRVARRRRLARAVPRDVWM
ncbi:MAG TPA: hypothetical protein DEP66_05620 [Acidimicrobiaceae bacterium]|nr:hypothetical protein [Acidimicrobiaceae bacterium]HCB37673.1 hypothetical protein [Acidimicrobiaceae bacterium]